MMPWRKRKPAPPVEEQSARLEVLSYRISRLAGEIIRLTEEIRTEEKRRG